MRLALVLLLLIAAPTYGEDKKSLKGSLTIYASFDASEHADFTKGDKHLYTAETLKREKVAKGLDKGAAQLDEKGRFGGCLYYPTKSNQITFFKGAKNAHYSKGEYGSTISFWMSLTPDASVP